MNVEKFLSISKDNYKCVITLYIDDSFKTLCLINSE